MVNFILISSSFYITDLKLGSHFLGQGAGSGGAGGGWRCHYFGLKSCVAFVYQIKISPFLFPGGNCSFKYFYLILLLQAAVYNKFYEIN